MLQIEKESQTIMEKTIKLSLFITYFIEIGFSIRVVAKNRLKNRFDTCSPMRLKINISIEVRINKLIEDKQQRQSH